MKFAPNVRSFRYGPATNSSSSHSIVFFKDMIPVSEAGHEDGEYGWQNFVLSTPESKLDYVRVAFPHNQDEVRDYAERNGIRFTPNDNGYIDHESQGILSPPSGFAFDEWLDVVMSPNVVILGGNDNDESFTQRLESNGYPLFNLLNARFKRDGDAVIGFNNVTGDKIRISSAPYEKSSAPELVDVKVTDKCSFGCKYCYQGSTPEDNHADLDYLEKLLKTLGESGTFEIAIGGGEPTEHPQFVEIVRMALNNNINPNFTTFSTKWAEDDAFLDDLQKATSKSYGSLLGVGVSVISKKDLKKVATINRALREKGVRSHVLAQTVVGAAGADVLREMIDVAFSHGLPVLLLGYKRVGRGVDFPHKPVSDEEMRDILTWVRDTKYFVGNDIPMKGELSVDTAFLEQYGHVLDEIGVSKVLRTSPEGAFSMYVDAVKKEMGPSSWHPDRMMSLEDPEEVVEKYRTINPVSFGVNEELGI